MSEPQTITDEQAQTLVRQGLFRVAAGTPDRIDAAADELDRCNAAWLTVGGVLFSLTPPSALPAEALSTELALARLAQASAAPRGQPPRASARALAFLAEADRRRREGERLAARLAEREREHGQLQLQLEAQKAARFDERIAQLEGERRKLAATRPDPQPQAGDEPDQNDDPSDLAPPARARVRPTKETK